MFSQHSKGIAMASLHIPESHLNVLVSLINKLKECQVLSKDEVSRLHTSASDNTFKTLISDGVSWGVAWGGADIYQKPEDEFFEGLRSINDNLLEQLKLFSFFVDDWFGKGSHPPPHYADRITVILRKAKRFDLEMDFLTAYFRHFWSLTGSTKDQKLGERAKSIGIDIPSIPVSSQWYRAEEIAWAEELKIKNLAVDINRVKPEGETESIVNFKFYCLQCGGKVLDVEDDGDDSSKARCKKCKTDFGLMGDVKLWLSRIAKKYIQIFG